MTKKNIELKPILFSEAMQKLDTKEFEIPTLGGRSKLRIKKENNVIIITNSGNKSLDINEDQWKEVINRMISLPKEERNMTSRYAMGKKEYNWRECPNRIFSPYIPAIVKHLSN
jgi:hypothetical protein